LDDARQSEGRAGEGGAVRSELREDNVPRVIVQCAAAHISRIFGVFLAEAELRALFDARNSITSYQLAKRISSERK
jgi:hypothetical protein